MSLSCWNYRLFQATDGTYGIREAYYAHRTDELPNGWTKPLVLDRESCGLTDPEIMEKDEAEVREELITMLEQVIEGLKKPTVIIDDPKHD